LSEADLRKLDALIVMDILPNSSTPLATVLLPASGWAEKRGSMINVKAGCSGSTVRSMLPASSG
jgi:predicted molibdopterin-dependent oxidoreductase YjgC